VNSKCRSWFLLSATVCGPLTLLSQTQTTSSPNKTTATQKNTSSQKTVQKSEPTPKRVPVVTKLDGFDLASADRLQKQSMTVGATRGGKHNRPIALAPHLGRMYINSRFAWRYKGEATRFVFVLEDESQTELLRTPVNCTEFGYPSSAPALRPGGTYFWIVESSSQSGKVERSVPASFIVVDEAERRSIEGTLAKISESDDYQAGLAKAQVFVEARLWYDAVSAYSELITSYPNRPEAYEKRGVVYAQLETTEPEASEDFARAEELRSRR